MAGPVKKQSGQAKPAAGAPVKKAKVQLPVEASDSEDNSLGSDSSSDDAPVPVRIVRGDDSLSDSSSDDDQDLLDESEEDESSDEQPAAIKRPRSPSSSSGSD